jgi:hypothetical protein
MSQRRPRSTRRGLGAPGRAVCSGTVTHPEGPPQPRERVQQIIDTLWQEASTEAHRVAGNELELCVGVLDLEVRRISTCAWPGTRSRKPSAKPADGPARPSRSRGGAQHLRHHCPAEQQECDERHGSEDQHGHQKSARPVQEADAGAGEPDGCEPEHPVKYEETPYRVPRRRASSSCQSVTCRPSETTWSGPALRFEYEIGAPTSSPGSLGATPVC